MTKEELKQEAEEWLCNNLHSASEEYFIKAMVDIAEPREKRIAELEDKLANADYQLEGRDNEIRELKERLAIINLNGNIVLRELTKAKEIIENLLYYVKQCTCERSNYAEIEEDIKEAEQFIKDSEVEK